MGSSRARREREEKEDRTCQNVPREGKQDGEKQEEDTGAGGTMSGSSKQDELPAGGGGRHVGWGMTRGNHWI